MKNKPFFVFFPVLVGVIVYAYYAPQDKPERATTLTPKQYIELVEKKKLEKKQLTKEAKKESTQSKTTQDNNKTPNN